MGGWNVIDAERGVLSMEYAFSDKGRAHSFAARLADGSMYVMSPGTNLTDADYTQLDGFGKVSAVATNNGFHHLGQGAWRERYPDARYFAPTKAAERIASKSELDLAFESMDALQELMGDDVGFREAPSTKCGEAWTWARTGDGWAVYCGDLLCNWDSFPGNFLLNMMWKLTGSGPGYKPFNLAMMAILKDKKSALRAFLADVEAHPPTTVVLAHGAAVTGPDTADRTKGVVGGAL